MQALGIIIFAALPIVELRGAILYAIISQGFDPVQAFILAVIGNLIPVVFLLLLLPHAERLGRKYSTTLDKLFTWWFGRVVRNHEKTFERWGALALILLVAIPLPMTGAWSGSAAAYLFKINKIPAFFYITIGVIIAGGLVTFLTITGISFFK
jgi:uncharacterized membrane protein